MKTEEYDIAVVGAGAAGLAAAAETAAAGRSTLQTPGTLRISRRIDSSVFASQE